MPDLLQFFWLCEIYGGWQHCQPLFVKHQPRTVCALLTRPSRIIKVTRGKTAEQEEEEEEVASPPWQEEDELIHHEAYWR